MAFTGSTETMAESGVRKGDLVTTPSLYTKTDRYSGVGGAQGRPGHNTNPPPPKPGLKETTYSGVCEGNLFTTPTNPTRTERDSRVGVA